MRKILVGVLCICFTLSFANPKDEDLEIDKLSVGELSNGLTRATFRTFGLHTPNLSKYWGR